MFPTADGTVRLGIGVLDPDTDVSPKTVMDTFVSEGHATRYGLVIPPDYETNAGIIPSVPYNPNLVFDNVIRTGDAGNFATPTVGEGIRIAIEFGRRLGGDLTAQIRGDDFALKRYQAAAAQRFKMNYRFGLMMNKRIAGYTPERWDKSVRRLARLREQEMTQLVRSQFSSSMIARTILLSVKGKLLG